MGLWLGQGISQNRRRMRLGLYRVGGAGGTWVRELRVMGLWDRGGRLPSTRMLGLLQRQRNIARTTHG